jgi:hypothetical protein
MPTNTDKLNLPKPEGLDYFNRTNFNELVEAIDENAVGQNEKGSANGVAPLDGNAKVPNANLPKVTDADMVDGKHFSDIQAAAQIKADAAEQAAINWAKSFGLGATATSTPVTDLNDLKASGFYWASSNIANKPNDVNCHILVISYSSAYVVQMAFRHTSGVKTSVRYLEAGLWTAWQELETVSGAQDKANKAETAAKNAASDAQTNAINFAKGFGLGAIGQKSTDLNTSQDGGIYYYLGDAQNKPNSEGGVFLALRGSNFAQIAITISGKMFRRSYSSGSWSAWTEQETTGGSQSKANTAETNAINFAKDFGLGDIAKRLQNTDDLNNLLTTGFYYGWSSCGNMPVGVSCFIIVMRYSDSYTMQMAFQADSSRKVYVRTQTGGTWSSWTEQETTSGAQSKANSAIASAKTYTDNHANKKDNPHNVTSEQITAITSKNSSDGPASYPMGVTMFSSSTEAAGFPYPLGTILTTKIADHRMGQLFFGKQQNTFHFRTSLDGTTWDPWTEVETTSGSQAKANAVQTNLNSHTGDSGIHITTSERTSWNGKETPSGAQSKATAAKNAAIAWAEGFGLGSTSYNFADDSLNNLYKGGFYYANSTATDKPSGVANGHVLVFSLSSSYIVQWYIPNNDTVMYMRIRSNGTWNSWVQLESTAGSQAKANAVQSNLNSHTGSGGSAHALATTGAHGFMSNTDKSKLNGIESGAEANEAAFAYMKANGILSAASAVKDTFEFLGGSGVSLSMDASLDRLQISLDSTVVRNSDFNDNLLWSGQVYPTADQTVTPTKRLSECRNGWVLIWSDYDVGVGTNDFHFVHSFIHKSQLNLPLNGGTFVNVPATNDGSEASRTLVKSLIVHDTKLVGYDSNRDFTWANDAVLRRVYEF